MSKLTAYWRERIVDAAIKDKFDPLKAALAAELVQIGDDIYAHFISARKRASIDALLKLELFPMQADAYVNCAGLKIRIAFSEPRAVPHHSRHSYSMPKWVLPGGADLADRLLAHADREKQLTDDLSTAKAKLLAMLNSIATTKQLQELWPEGEPYYAAYMKNKPQLPAIATDEINALFGLPKLPPASAAAERETAAE